MLSGTGATTMTTATTTFLCSTCATSFDSNEARREHMREAWHVYNMKRKIAELPPIPLHLYESLPGVASPSDTESDDHLSDVENTKPQTRSRDAADPSDDDDDDDDDTSTPLPSPEQCLFCPSTSPTIPSNLHHMSTSHSFHIPNPSGLQTDLETFLSYLSLVIHRFHACLACGHERASAEAVRAHMRAKGHCRLDPADPEFADFWTAESDGEGDAAGADPVAVAGRMLSGTEMRLPSGAVVESRQDGRPAGTRAPRARGPRGEQSALVPVPRDRSASPPASTTPPPAAAQAQTTSLALSRRDEMGIVGLSDAQRRALAAVRKKLVRREQRGRNEARWALEKGGNKVKQKHFKVTRSGEWFIEFC